MAGYAIDHLMPIDPVPMLGIINYGCCWLLESCSSASTRHSSKSNSANDTVSKNRYSVQTIAVGAWVVGNAMLLLIRKLSAYSMRCDIKFSIVLIRLEWRKPLEIERICF